MSKEAAHPLERRTACAGPTTLLEHAILGGTAVVAFSLDLGIVLGAVEDPAVSVERRTDVVDNPFVLAH